MAGIRELKRNRKEKTIMKLLVALSFTLMFAFVSAADAQCVKCVGIRCFGGIRINCETFVGGCASWGICPVILASAGCQGSWEIVKADVTLSRDIWLIPRHQMIATARFDATALSVDSTTPLPRWVQTSLYQ